MRGKIRLVIVAMLAALLAAGVALATGSFNFN